MIFHSRTFHVPVVTPYELELGLGARDWECFYLTTLTGRGLYTTSATDNEYQLKLDKVRSNRVRNSSSDSSEDETDEPVEANQITTTAPSSKITTTVSMKSESAVTIFQSAAANYLSNRDYKGLEPSIPRDMTTEIAKGQFGIASSYTNSLGEEEVEERQVQEQKQGGEKMKEDHS
jgi:diphthamide biosynthesis protein 2